MEGNAPAERSGGPARGSALDALMERASLALERTDYFEAERLAAEALERAHRAGEFEAMARILLPLQEARRQVRQLAVDSGVRVLVTDLGGLGGLRPGCYLVQPPLLGVDARSIRETARGTGIPVLVLAREPLTRDGRWPVVAVGDEMALRAKVAPPRPLVRLEASPTKDDFGLAGAEPPPREWFEQAEEALGDAAIERLDPEEPAPWLVDDLVRALGAHPTHEKLHQRLAEECRRAAHGEIPDAGPHRPAGEDAFD
ncbi:MAG: hypothetical protein WD749_00625 [Phycisphaerales bacterium]